MGDTKDRRESLFSLEDIIRALSSCLGGTPSPRVADIYAALSRQWKAAARRRFPWLGEADVEDAVQDTWAKLIEPARLRALQAMFADGQFAGAHAFESWAFSVFRNTSLDNGRVLRRREEPLAPDDPRQARIACEATDVEKAAERRELLERIWQAIRSSRIADAEYLLGAHFVEGRSDQEIADARDTTRDSVASRLKRMRKLIHEIASKGGSKR